MKRALPFVLIAAGFAEPALAQKVVFLVRHAEKADSSDDPLLSAAGTARAEALARHLAAAGVKAVFATQYQRTVLTAQPLTTKLGLKPIVIHSDASQELVDRMRKDYPNEVVLMAGHTNSVPRALKLLGVTETVEISETEYDNLFVVIPKASGPPTFLRLKY
jgi:phosphohistidine phosphatase SixA